MKDLEHLLIRHLGAQIYPINKVPKTCCFHSPLRVLDFDEVVKSFSINFSLPRTLCSADCLYIHPSKDLLCFIEMKNISMHLKTTSKKYKLYANFSQSISKWFEELHFNLRDKLTDSIYVVTAAAGLYGSHANTLFKLTNRKKSTIKYALVAYMKSSDYLTYSLATLDIKKIKHKLLEGPDFTSHLITNEKEFEAFIAEHLC